MGASRAGRAVRTARLAGFREFGATLIAVAAFGVSGALLLAIAQAGIASLETLLIEVAIPAIAVLLILWASARACGWYRLRNAMVASVWIGLVAALGLEIVRAIGFRFFHSMPGSLPMLMGMLMTDHIAQGATIWTDLAGWAYHFWNGVSFAGIYLLLIGKRYPWLAVIYGLGVGTGFLVSPATTAVGAGFFGLTFGAGMLVTVYIAHLVFGSLLGLLATRSKLVDDWVLVLLRRD